MANFLRASVVRVISEGMGNWSAVVGFEFGLARRDAAVRIRGDLCVSESDLTSMLMLGVGARDAQ